MVITHAVNYVLASVTTHCFILPSFKKWSMRKLLESGND